jgi:hypothetical protein
VRILFITPVAPELALGGGRTATESFLEVLRASPIDAKVDVLALRTGRAILPHRARQAVALVRSVASTLPSKSLFEATGASIERVKRALDAQPYDLVVVNGGDLFFLSRYSRPGQKWIGFALNLEGDLYEQQTRTLRKLPLLGRFFARDLAKLRRDEIEGVHRLAGVVCLSADDAGRMRAIAPQVPALALPTSFLYPPYRRERDRVVRRPLRLGFLAKFGWWPNAEAAEWMIGNVLPGLPAGSVELHLYGPRSERFQGRHPAITAHGFVDDLARVWERSDIIVCPIVSGSGINIKVVEALYNGNPMLATSYATRGLPPLADPALVRLDTPEEWISFLSGGEAERLARMRPDPGLSALFSTRSAVPRLAEFISSLGRDVHSSVDAQPKVSIVTVTFNAARTLQSTIDSVVKQDYPRIEHIVIDGGSTDGTVDIIRGNAARLAFWSTGPDSGIYDAMNKGVEKATGDWVLFLNADDALYDARTISSVFAGASGWSGKQVIYGHSVMQMDGGRARLRRSKALRTIHFKMPFTHQGVFVSATLLRERPFNTRYRIAADYDFFRDVYGRHGSAAFQDSGVCINYFRVGGASYQRLGVKHREFLDVIRRNERGARLWFYVAQYAIRCIGPERVRGLLGMEG